VSVGRVIETGDWAKVDRITRTMVARFNRAREEAVYKEAHFLRGKIVEGIRSGAPAGKKFKPHSRMTLAIRAFTGKRSSKILIASGGLIGSVAVVKVSGGYFVGVKRKAKGGADIAAIHEEGRTWTQRMTPRMRRFLFAALRYAGMQGREKGDGGKGSLTIRIPARPYVGPIMKKYGTAAQVGPRVWGRIAVSMGGDFGKL